MADEKTEELAAYLTGLVEAATGLRFDPLPDITEANPGALFAAMLATRARLDRLEGILGRLTGMRGQAHRAKSAAEALFQEAWDEKCVASQTSRVEYTAAKERYADIGVATIAPAREARRRTHAASLVDDAYETVRLYHRGLDGVRMDIHRVYGALVVERSIDRQGTAG